MNFIDMLKNIELLIIGDNKQTSKKLKQTHKYNKKHKEKHK